MTSFLRRALSSSLAAGLALAGPCLLGQEITPPSANTPLMPPILGPGWSPPPVAGNYGTEPVAPPAGNVAPGISTAGTEGPPLSWGSLVFHPHPYYEYTYGSGIEASPGHPLSTATQSMSPGFSLEEGGIWTLDYTPVWQVYSNSAFHDTVDQTARLSGSTTYEDWTLSLSQDYVRSNDPLVETGLQTLTEQYDTSLGASYGSPGHDLLDLSANQQLRYSPANTNSYDWSASAWGHLPMPYPQFDLSAGPTVGYLANVPGVDMDYVQAQGKFGLQISDKVSFQAQGGVEAERFIAPDVRTRDTPVYSGVLSYRPTDATAFLLQGGRSISPAYEANELSDITDVNLGIQQRLLGHFHLDATVGEETENYIVESQTLPEIRGDRLKTLQLSLNTVVLHHFSVAVQYQRNLNASNLPQYGFSSYQLGFVIGARF